ncbi:MAG TPA: chalcone isomerase family protein [Acetobacteraceae bacterium]|jgi:hypothetical protein|nr:chalcone isomerase family protein [Acetobacteraceae bacterium]
MIRGLALVAATFAFLSVANAAELDGVYMPDEQVVDGTRLWLNGIGLRTYSIFDIRIYVAGLYLQQRSNDSDTIVQSKGFKLLVIRFLHDVTAAQARNAWQEGFKQNCRSPCQLDPHDVQEFLAHVRPARKGETISLLFTPTGARVTDGGQLLGTIDHPHFAEIMLDTFIGPVPPTNLLKRGLLGLSQQQPSRDDTILSARASQR